MCYSWWLISHLDSSSTLTLGMKTRLTRTIHLESMFCHCNTILVSVMCSKSATAVDLLSDCRSLKFNSNFMIILWTFVIKLVVDCSDNGYCCWQSESERWGHCKATVGQCGNCSCYLYCSHKLFYFFFSVFLGLTANIQKCFLGWYCYRADRNALSLCQICHIVL